MALPSEVEVAIIGAGAAGLGAARRWKTPALGRRAGSARPCRRPRPHHHGGPRYRLRPRLRLVALRRPEFLRQNRRTTGFRNRQDPPAWREQSFDAGFPPKERADFIEAIDEFYDRAEEAAKTGRDSPASAWLEPGNRWNPMIDAISTYVNGCELDRVSILDMDAYQDTGINWRVRRGFGALMAAYGARCPLAFNCNVTRIDHSGPRLRIETSRGTLSAAKAIITVPTDLIADEAIAFYPALPAKVDAARGCRSVSTTR